jgi:hypothetical protein
VLGRVTGWAGRVEGISAGLVTGLVVGGGAIGCTGLGGRYAGGR